MSKDDVEVEKALSKISPKRSRFGRSRVAKAFSKGVTAKKPPPPPHWVVSGTPKTTATPTKNKTGQQAKTWFGFPLDPIDDEMEFLGDNEPKDDYPTSDSCKVIINGVEGCTCKKCKDFYPYAEPNMDKEQFVCYSCRLDAEISSGKK